MIGYLFAASEQCVGLPVVRNRFVLLILWTLLAMLVLAIDYLTGPFIRFPIMYLIPICLIAWVNGFRWALVFAVAMPLVHLSFRKFWVTPFRFYDAIVNTAILIVVFVVFSYLVNKVGVQKRELEKEIRTLEGILPICSFCKKIRNQENTWEPFEGYISRHTEAEFSHGMCPDCARKHYPDFFKE
jgi:K+-sensing histidine kinase KdpD